MSLIVKTESIPLIAPDTYPAVCYGIIDIGEQYNEKYEKWSRKVVILWELPGEKIELGGELVSRTMSKIYTMPRSMENERSNLRNDLIAWRGKPFTAEEIKEFDLRKIVGIPCQLSIIHKESNGKTYANIAAIMKMGKGMTIEDATLPPIIFDLDEDPLSMIESMPDWIKDLICKSRTYQSRISPKTDVGAEDFEINTDALDRANEYDDDDEDVPF